MNVYVTIWSETIRYHKVISQKEFGRIPQIGEVVVFVNGYECEIEEVKHRLANPNRGIHITSRKWRGFGAHEQSLYDKDDWERTPGYNV